MSTQIPETLYRYRSISTHTLETLCSDQLWFSNPSTFNDPMDCRPVVTCNSNKSSLQEILSELIRQRVWQETLAAVPQLDQKEDFRKHVEDIAQQKVQCELKQAYFTSTNPDYGDDREKTECDVLTWEIQSEILMRYARGVCCFSSCYDNPLLWSHYGDQHRGICIGYKATHLTSGPPKQVEYGGSRIIPTDLIENAILKKNTCAQLTLDKSILLRKAFPWNYENEWRMIGSIGAQNSTLLLSDIIFGLRCSIAHQYMIYKAFKKRNVTFHKMKEVYGEYKLERHSFDSEEICAFYPRDHHEMLEQFSSRICATDKIEDN